MNYKTSLKQLLSLIDFERPTNNIDKSQYHLHRIEEILKKLGDPHLAIPTIHVAGTKGKGSTAALFHLFYLLRVTELGFIPLLIFIPSGKG